MKNGCFSVQISGDNQFDAFLLIRQLKLQSIKTSKSIEEQHGPTKNEEPSSAIISQLLIAADLCDS